MMRFKDRAERIEPSQIIETFVDVGPLLNILESENNQLVYGRRGVGKTHALLYLGDRRTAAGDFVVYVD
jgi:Cdc6-like AAA superfamily ATPase